MLTEQEKLVHELLGDAANAFARLEREEGPLHPSDREDFIHAIHAAQNIVLARSGLRAYRGKDVD